MATVDEQIQLAEQIVGALSGVRRNDWVRWLQIAERYGLDQAREWAQRLSKDVTIRNDIQTANYRIARAVSSYQHALKKLSTQQCKETLGYIGRLLKVAEEEKKEQSDKRYQKQKRR
jgi:hypothetical protein